MATPRAVRTGRSPRAVEQVVLAVVVGHPRLQRRPGEQEHEGEPGQQTPGQNSSEIGYPSTVDSPRRKQPEGPLEPTRCTNPAARRSHGRRLERPVQPDRVDLDEPAEQGEHGRDARRGGRPSEARSVGQSGVPTMLSSRPAGAGELGVLLPPQDRHVRADQRQRAAAGRSRMWTTYSRPDRLGPGNSPPNSRNASQVPTIGIDSTIE